MEPPVYTGLGPVALQILAYLDTHRNAQDTVEGIAEWWLLEQRISHVVTEVKQALGELVAQGIILERRGRDGHVRYRLNRGKQAALDHLVRRASSEPSARRPRSTDGAAMERSDP